MPRGITSSQRQNQTTTWRRTPLDRCTRGRLQAFNPVRNDDISGFRTEIRRMALVNGYMVDISNSGTADMPLAQGWPNNAGAGGVDLPPNWPNV